MFIEPGSPWENGSVESFTGTWRDELLDREIFYTRTEATVLIERWRRAYHTVRPHRALVWIVYTRLCPAGVDRTGLLEYAERLLPALQGHAREYARMDTRGMDAEPFDVL